MSGSPSISVICTARNAAATIERSLASMAAQTWSDWEMIIVDDGSTDATCSIVEEVVRRDRRFRLIATLGIGRAPALNLALSEAEAPLVANLDADDESHPERLRHQLDAVRRRPELTVLSTTYFRIRGDEVPRWPWAAETTGEVLDVTGRLARSNPVCHSSILMTREAALAVGGYRPGFSVDYDLWVRMAGAGHRIGRIEQPLVAKRIHPGQWYLHRHRLPYLISTMRIQARAIRLLGVRAYCFWPLVPMRLVWGFLPLSLRIALRNPSRLISRCG
jgi:cellulose synthase/poly-beta-1,6-N-acetylglucosamine synthase-like glycosyltransferase